MSDFYRTRQDNNMIKLQKLRQTSTVSQYADIFDEQYKMLNNLQKTDQTWILYVFYSGLSEQLKKELRYLDLDQFENYKELLKYVLKTENNLDKFSSKYLNQLNSCNLHFINHIKNLLEQDDLIHVDSINNLLNCLKNTNAELSANHGIEKIAYEKAKSEGSNEKLIQQSDSTKYSTTKFLCKINNLHIAFVKKLRKIIQDPDIEYYYGAVFVFAVRIEDILDELREAKKVANAEQTEEKRKWEWRMSGEEDILSGLQNMNLNAKEKDVKHVYETVGLIYECRY